MPSHVVDRYQVLLSASMFKVLNHRTQGPVLLYDDAVLKVYGCHVIVALADYCIEFFDLLMGA